MVELPPFAHAERDAILKEIEAAFDGVSREGGVSWSEAYEIDNWRPPAEEQAARQAAARASDLDTEWAQLVEDAEWHGDGETSAWSFLDAIGFRYYLPTVMIRCTRQGWSNDPIIFALTLDEDSLRDHQFDKWSLLDTRQRRCVKRFIGYMIVITGDAYSDLGLWDWRKAYASYWQNIPEAPTAPQP